MIPISDPELERRVVRYEFVKRVLIVVTAVMVATCLGILITLAAQSAHRGKENRETLTTIRDCTQPSGECYLRGKRQTADAVSNINTVIILAAACSAGLPPNLSVEQRQTDISTCVIDRLAKKN